MNITLEQHIDIDAPAAAAWRVLADYGRDPDWRQGVETMAPSPSGEVVPGTTTDEVLHLGGRTWRNGGIVTAVDPGRTFTWKTTSGSDADGGRTVTPLGPDRCHVRLELTLRPHGAERMLAPVLRRMARTTLAGDARRLADLVVAEHRDAAVNVG